MSLRNFYSTNSWKIGSKLALKRLFGSAIDNSLLIFDHLIAGKRSSIYSSPEGVLSSESRKLAIIATHILTPEGISNFIFPLADMLAKGYHVYIVDTGHLNFSTQNSKVVIMKRRNKGRDFGSFRDALNLLNLENIDELILMNDSCFWNKDSMGNYLDNLPKEFSDLRCITLSFQRAPHPQSYFLHISGPLIDTIRDFFKNEVRDWRFKRNIVKRGEIQLGRHLYKSGFKVVDFFGGRNSLYDSKKQKYLNFRFTNTMATHPKKIFEAVGVIKAKQKHLIDSCSDPKINITPEYKKIFYVV